ncbi:Protein-lysine N-methyltransferase EFM3 [Picochlorum sp. SENEW3]|nr:Protein-lysine N-methyltransferase EFM3 [Picochlorum sp. SENEW3]WPT14897.1 Protein-lysine N-methyltransferase EFM3 [Picochlorum sp. SENEW3]
MRASHTLRIPSAWPTTQRYGINFQLILFQNVISLGVVVALTMTTSENNSGSLDDSNGIPTPPKATNDHTIDDIKCKIQCLCRSKQPTTLVVRDLVTQLGLTEDVQEWFIKTCLRDEEWSEETLGQGDIVYWKRLLHALMKEIERDGSAVVADVVGNALVDLNMEQRREDMGGMECSSWLRKRYTYTGMNDCGKECCDDIEIWSHVNMFEGSTGCFEWDAGYFMAEYVMSHPEIFQNRVCMEIGCGCGMVTIVLSRLCGNSPVLATDGNEETLQNCASNMKRNGINIGSCHGYEQQEHTCRPVMMKCFQWEHGWHSLVQDEMLQEALNNHTNTSAPLCVLGADILYDPEIIPTIVPLIAEILEYMYQLRHGDESTNPSYVYLSTRRRSDTTLEKFLNAVKVEPHLCIEDLSEHAHATDAIRFCHIPSLDDSRTAESILLHRLWYSIEC